MRGEVQARPQLPSDKARESQTPETQVYHATKVLPMTVEHATVVSLKEKLAEIG